LLPTAYRKDPPMARAGLEIELPRSEMVDLSQTGSRTTEDHRRLKAQLHHQLVANMDLSVLGTMEKEQLRVEVRRVADDLCQRSSSLLNRTERERLVNEVLDETFGLGPLEPLMNDPTITDILINGHNTVYVERHGMLELTPVSFSDEQHLLH